MKRAAPDLSGVQGCRGLAKTGSITVFVSGKETKQVAVVAEIASGEDKRPKLAVFYIYAMPTCILYILIDIPYI